MKTLVNYFPLGIAKGAAFCNRISEQKVIKDNIMYGRHSVVVAPRRYGKSSLVCCVLNNIKLPFSRIDFFITVDEQIIENEVIQKVNELISLVSTKQELLFKTLKNYIKRLKLKLIIGSDGTNIEISPPPAEKGNTAQNIRSALLLLENFLASKKKKAILFMDEFQQVGIVAQNTGIEGAIRSVAQEAKYLNIIFSGSSRHLLSQMFEDRNRPLYKLCDRITLERISISDYVKYITKCSIATWKKAISKDLIQLIYNTTEGHPYYMNILCSRVWSAFPQEPPKKTSDIKNLWLTFVEEQRSDVAQELSFLSDLQKKLIINIALGNNTELRSKENLIKFNASSSSITKALNVLVKQDYIFKSHDGAYQLIDPLIKTSLKHQYEN